MDLQLRNHSDLWPIFVCFFCKAYSKKLNGFKASLALVNSQ